MFKQRFRRKDHFPQVKQCSSIKCDNSVFENSLDEKHNGIFAFFFTICKIRSQFRSKAYIVVNF